MVVFGGELGGKKPSKMCLKTFENPGPEAQKSRSGGVSGRLGLVLGRLGASWERLGASWVRLGGVLGVLEVSWASKKFLKPAKNQHVSFWYPLGSWAVL